jgi:hypothetical protein
MSITIARTIQLLEEIVKVLPVGTNLALLHLMWAMLNGSFLKSRGAVHGALAESGFTPRQIRRSWAALRYGKWSITELVLRWREIVKQEDRWQAYEREGYRPLAVDITAFWRPKLKGWLGKFFYRLANRLMKGVGLGLVTEIGHVDGQRIPLLKRIIRVKKKEMRETDLKAYILQLTPSYMDEDEVFIHDASVGIAEVQTAKIPRYVIRLDVNITGRRNYLPPKKNKGRRAEYGEKVRPLSRQRLAKMIQATPPDTTVEFEFQGRTIKAQGWFELTRSDQKVVEATETFTIWVFFDPLFQKPLVLGTNIAAKAETLFLLYRDRWPVEQPPLVAKQMLGLHRQFVFSPVCVLRLPELALLVANILTYLAAVLPAMPTGFWDRQPKRTSGRLRRTLAGAVFPNEYPFDERLREKQSVIDHLPKGILAHRRVKQHQLAASTST